MLARRPAAPAMVTAICFVMAILAWGTVFYGHSVYMDGLMRGHRWSAALISSAILVFWLASLPGTLCVGFLIDRAGPAPVVAIGGFCIGGGLIALAALSAPWQLFVVYAVMGFGYPALAGAAISATLAPWFDRGFGTALGIALTGASVGGALLPLLIVRTAAVEGFEATMVVVGASLLVVVLIAVAALAWIGRPLAAADEDQDRPEAPFSVRAVARRPVFWKISIAAAIGLGGQVGLLAHQIPVIAAQSDQTTASLMVTVVAVASAIGRLIVAQLTRVLPVSTVAALSYGVHGAGIAILAMAGSVTWIFVGCAVAGLVVGAIVMVPPLLVRHAFGPADFGRTYAMVNVVMYVLAALSPWMVGILHDLGGGYTYGLSMLVVMEIVAAVLILGAMRRVK